MSDHNRCLKIAQDGDALNSTDPQLATWSPTDRQLATWSQSLCACPIGRAIVQHMATELLAHRRKAVTP